MTIEEALVLVMLLLAFQIRFLAFPLVVLDLLFSSLDSLYHALLPLTLHEPRFLVLVQTKDEKAKELQVRYSIVEDYLREDVVMMAIDL